MKIIHCEQGSPEWLEARTGMVTASRTKAALSFLKRGERCGGDTAERAALKAALVSEILTGRCSEAYVSSYMQYGTATEPLARTAYELRNDVLVEIVGFGIHEHIDRFGSSPDGLVGKDGMVEFKCPQTATHIDYMLAGKLPSEYEPQVMSNLAVWEREWIDFVSYDVRLPQRHQQFKVRVYRDEKRIAEIEAGVRQFLNEVDWLIARLNQLNPEPDEFKKQLRAAVVDDGMGLGQAEYEILMRSSVL